MILVDLWNRWQQSKPRKTWTLPRMADASKDGDAKGGGDAGAGKGDGDKNKDGDKSTVSEAESDRRVNQGIETAKKKWEADQKTTSDAVTKKAEAEKLAEQGKFQELHSASIAELEELKAEVARSKFRDDAREVLAKQGLSDFEPILTGDLSTMEGFTKATEQLQELINAKVESAVKDKLGTGDRSTSSTNEGAGAEGTKKAGDMDRGEKTKYIKEHGLEKWEAKLRVDYSQGYSSKASGQ